MSLGPDFKHATRLGSDFKHRDVVKVRRVRTAAGAKRYGVPIGSPIPPGGLKRLRPPNPEMAEIARRRRERPSNPANSRSRAGSRSSKPFDPDGWKNLSPNVGGGPSGPAERRAARADRLSARAVDLSRETRQQAKEGRLARRRQPGKNPLSTKPKRKMVPGMDLNELSNNELRYLADGRGNVGFAKPAQTILRERNASRRGKPSGPSRIKGDKLDGPQGARLKGKIDAARGEKDYASLDIMELHRLALLGDKKAKAALDIRRQQNKKRYQEKARAADVLGDARAYRTRK